MMPDWARAKAALVSGLVKMAVLLTHVAQFAPFSSAWRTVAYLHFGAREARRYRVRGPPALRATEGDQGVRVGQRGAGASGGPCGLP